MVAPRSASPTVIGRSIDSTSMRSVWTVELAPKGGTPGGYKVRTYQVSAVVDAIDYKSRYVSLRGPKGNTLSMPVSEDVKDFDKVKVGDKLTIAYSQALALEMVPQEAPKKAAAKKK